MGAKIISIFLNISVFILAVGSGVMVCVAESNNAELGNDRMRNVGLDIGLPIVEKKTNGGAFIGIYKSDGITTLSRIISEAIKYVSVLAMIAITWGGVTYITAYGDEKKVGKAKNIILYSLLAVVLSISAYAIIDVINNLKVT